MYVRPGFDPHPILLPSSKHVDSLLYCQDDPGLQICRLKHAALNINSPFRTPWLAFGLSRQDRKGARLCSSQYTGSDKVFAAEALRSEPAIVACLPITAPPTTTRSNKPKPVKNQPIPILETSGGRMTAAIAAPGLRSMFPSANAPAACCGAHSDRKAVVAIKTQLIPKPAGQSQYCHLSSTNW